MFAIDHVQIAMPAGGEAAARHFYGALLGLAEIAKPAELTGRGGCWFAVGDRQLHLGVESDFRPALKAHVALATPGLDVLAARLAAAGFAIVVDVPVDGRPRFFSADPFGNRIEFLADAAAPDLSCG